MPGQKKRRENRQKRLNQDQPAPNQVLDAYNANCFEVAERAFEALRAGAIALGAAPQGQAPVRQTTRPIVHGTEQHRTQARERGQNDHHQDNMDSFRPGDNRSRSPQNKGKQYRRRSPARKRQPSHNLVGSRESRVRLFDSPTCQNLTISTSR